VYKKITLQVYLTFNITGHPFCKIEIYSYLSSIKNNSKGCLEMKNTKLKLTSQTSITGQHIYIGIDVHNNQWTIAVSADGMILRNLVINAEPEDLVKYLQREFPGLKYNSVYEAGYCGFWIHRKLKELGINNIVVNPADVPTRNKERRGKTDKVDCAKLARELSNNNLTGIYIPSPEEETFRSVVRYRAQLVKDQTRTKNRIKSFLRYYGIKFPINREMQHWSKRFIDYLRKIQLRDEPARETLHGLIDNLIFLRGKILTVLNKIRRLIAEDPIKKRVAINLVSTPGIGSVTAATIIGDLMNINRFPKFEQLSSMVGFAPDTSSSGQEDKNLGLTVRSNRYLRSLLIESAWIAIKYDSILSTKYLELRKRMNKQRAIIRIAKKLLSRIMYLWKNDKEYQFGVI
jgi:transposase